MLFRLLYNLVLLLLVLIWLPLAFYQRIRFGKYKDSLLQKMGFFIPSLHKQASDKVIWIHTISLGETKAASSYFHMMKNRYPNAKFVVSTITDTGMKEAVKSMADADLHFYLPLDFSWVMKSIMKKIAPDLVVLTESDLWYHFLFYAKKRGATTLLINGKLSERSLKRYGRARFFFTKILRCFDCICVQSSLYKDRFMALGAPAHLVKVTGNIKLDAAPKILDPAIKQKLKNELTIQSQDKVIVLGSTHYPEEEMILTIIAPLLEKDPHIKLLLCPRHSERCAEVRSLLEKRGLSYFNYSERAQRFNAQAKVILIDVSGILTDIYQISDLALVCGSFTDTVGGHNIFEPILYDVPAFFGPHMFSQRDLRDLIKPSGAGKQVRLEDLCSSIESYFAKPLEQQKYKEKCRSLKEEVRGALEKTVFETQNVWSKK